MNLRVQLFAAAKQLSGRDSLDVEVGQRATVADLRDALARQAPELATLLPRMRIAVNHEYVPDTSVLVADSEIACIPPVSGG